MHVEEKNITCSQLCKTFDETFLSKTQKSHFSKHAANHKTVTTSGRARDSVFGHDLVHTCPQLDHKMPES